MKKALLTLVVLLSVASISEAGVFFNPFRTQRVIQNNVIINKTFVPAQQVVVQRQVFNVNKTFIPFNSFSAINYGVSRSLVPLNTFSYGQTFQAPLLIQATPVAIPSATYQYVPSQVQYNLGVPQTQTTITTTTTTTNLLGR